MIPTTFNLTEFISNNIDTSEENIFAALIAEGVTGLSLASCLHAVLKRQANNEAFSIVEDNLSQMLVDMYNAFESIMPVLKAEASGVIGDDSIRLTDSYQKIGKDDNLVPIAKTWQGYLYLALNQIPKMFDKNGNRIMDLENS